MAFKFGISSYNCHKFLLRLFYNHYFLLYTRYSPSKIWKKNLWQCLFLYFFQIFHQDHTPFNFFAGFQWNMLGNSINIKNFSRNPAAPKMFLLRPLKIRHHFLNQLVQKWGLHDGPYPKQKKLFSEITKPPDHKAFKTFLF